MNFVSLIILFQFVLSSIIASLGIWTWINKGKSLQSHSILMIYLSVASWLIINTLELLATGFELKYFWGRVQYIPLVILPIAWYYFALSYSQPHHRLRKLDYFLPIGVATVIAILALTNEIHHLFWTDVSLNTSLSIAYLDQKIGIAFVAYVLYLLVMLVLGIYQIIINIRLSGPTQSWQSTVLLMSAIAVCASVAWDISDLTFLPEPELTSFVLAFVVPIVGNILDRLRYADIMPAAYSQVFKHLDDGVIVTSPDHRILDMNERARSLVTNPHSDYMKDVSQVFPFIAPLTRNGELREVSSVKINMDSESFIFDISMASIKDNRSNIMSHIFLLQDVTERDVRERILLQRNEELEILNQISGFASSSRDITDILTFVVELASMTFKTSSAYIAKVDLAEDQLTIMAGFVDLYAKYTVASNDSLQLDFKLSEIAPHLTDWLIDPKHHNITHVDPTSNDEVNRTLQAYLFKSALSFPIYIKSKLYGFISIVESEKPREFEVSEIQLLQSIAHQVGSAIENAQLYSELTRGVQERAITEEQLRNSLEEKNTLLKEVHHRVKNNLQVISSLLRLQLAVANDPKMNELIQDSQSRIQSMALVHELLYQSEDLSTIDLGEYLEFLSHSLMASYQSKSQHISILADCHSFDVTIETAITCGLLLNELVSNAIKHAFPSQRSGTITVRLSPLDDQTMQLVVADDGIGMPTKEDTDKQKNSLGLKLIDSFINQLLAQLTIKNDSGTRYEITMPIINGEQQAG